MHMRTWDDVHIMLIYIRNKCEQKEKWLKFK
jgi:hypothetical protein